MTPADIQRARREAHQAARADNRRDAIRLLVVVVLVVGVLVALAVFSR